MRSVQAIDADLRAKVKARHTDPHRGELRTEIDALLDERQRLRRGPLRPSQVMAGQR